MKSRKFCLLFVVSLVLILGGQTFSSDLEDYPVIQCGDDFISVGDRRSSVLEKCGEPTYQEDFGNVWIYDYGPKEFVRYITFVDDSVERIQMGGYGKER